MDPLIGETVAGRYVIRRVLGSGAFAEIYQCDDLTTGKRVALTTVAAGRVARVSITPFAKGAEGKRPPKDSTPTFVPRDDPNAVEDLPNGER